MTQTLFTLTLIFLAGQPTPRQPHPLAPSIPLLSKEEYAHIEKIIDRFVQYDIGKLPKAEGKKAFADFQRLGPEAIFSLIDAFNQAAEMENSCPAVIIGRKIGLILNASDDLELLQFAKENLGAGVKARRHLGAIRDLQFGVQLRRGAVQRKLAGAGAAGAVRTMTVAQLAVAAGKERGLKLKNILTEIEKREGPQVLQTLDKAAAANDKDIRALAQGLLVKHLSRQKQEFLKAILKDDRPEVRAAAAQAVGSRKLKWGDELIALLEDKDAKVQQPLAGPWWPSAAGPTTVRFPTRRPRIGPLPFAAGASGGRGRNPSGERKINRDWLDLNWSDYPTWAESSDRISVRWKSAT